MEKDNKVLLKKIWGKVFLGIYVLFLLATIVCIIIGILNTVVFNKATNPASERLIELFWSAIAVAVVLIFLGFDYHRIDFQIHNWFRKIRKNKRKEGEK